MKKEDYVSQKNRELAEEAGRYKNREAITSLRKGLDQASKMQFSDSPPDVDSDAEDAE